MRLIDADKLCEEFKKRQKAALNWKEQAILNDNFESEIRADAVLAFLSEVKLTIDNAPILDLEKTIDEAFSSGYRAGTLDAISDSDRPNRCVRGRERIGTMEDKKLWVRKS